jgi:dCTP deaminase
MGVLTGRQIQALVEGKVLGIDPFDPDFQAPASYDLRLHHKLLASPVGEKVLGKVIDLRDTPEGFPILPGQMVGVLSLEKLSIPLNITGRFGIRSYFARKGLNAFGGLQLDPGFRGRLTMNLLNVGPESVHVSYKEPIFSVEFSRLDEDALPYEGEYQDQEDFPADQYNYILDARTTSLAEIPQLRSELNLLSGLFEEFGELIRDPDSGLELQPEIWQRLVESSKKPKESLLSSEEMKRRLEI